MLRSQTLLKLKRAANKKAKVELKSFYKGLANLNSSATILLHRLPWLQNLGLILVQNNNQEKRSTFHYSTIAVEILQFLLKRNNISPFFYHVWGYWAHQVHDSHSKLINSFPQLRSYFYSYLSHMLINYLIESLASHWVSEQLQQLINMSAIIWNVRRNWSIEGKPTSSHWESANSTLRAPW